ncbi:Uncharacterized protein C9orf43 [Vulpes lagopus]
MKSQRGLESCKIGFCPKPFVAMHLPDESQWDETTCKLAICQHPQCWATIRRIERGHPRILGTPRKTTIDDEGRPQKDLPNKDVIGDTDRSPKVNHRLTK